MKIIINTFISILFFSGVYAQDLAVVSKIEKDSISIKWLPSNFEQFQEIIKGAVIYRVESQKTDQFNLIDFSNATLWNIEPTINKYNELNLEIEEEEKMSFLLEPFFENFNSDELNNFSFGTALIENIVNPNFQFVVGNILVDKSFNKSKPYVYKVVVGKLNPVYIKIDPSSRTKYSEIDDLTLSLDKKKSVNIEWAYKKYEKEAFGFDIEHSIDKIKKDSFLTETPYLPFKSNYEIDDKLALYIDNPRPGHFHYYRLHGRDMFGHKSLISDWKKIYVPLLINAHIEIDSIYAKKAERIIEASVHQFNNESNIDKIQLLRSSELLTNFSVLKEFNFTDSILNFSIPQEKTGDRYYYKIAGINADDTVYTLPKYFFTLDQEPPNPPNGLEGTIDSNGVVLLNWSASNEDDIRGYKVYRANSKKEDFVERTTYLSDSLIFADTVSLYNLTSEVFYFIKVVDSNFNQSFSSDTILVLKPDTIPPVSCIIKDITLNNHELNINWINSESNDIKVNYLIRKSENSIDTVIYWGNNLNSFIDTNLSPGKYFSYSIITKDKSSNQSTSSTFSKYFEPGYRDTIENFTVKVDKVNKSIVLTWNKPEEEIFSYQIYRSIKGEKSLPLKTISNESVTRFIDKNVYLNNQYIYSLKYITKSGIHSLPALVEIIYQ